MQSWSSKAKGYWRQVEKRRSQNEEEGGIDYIDPDAKATWGCRKEEEREIRTNKESETQWHWSWMQIQSENKKGCPKTCSAIRKIWKEIGRSKKFEESLAGSG